MIKWTSEKIKKESVKYKTRSSFKDGNGSAYNAAKRLGILDKVCSHMLSKKETRNQASKKRRIWTPEKIMIEAAKYDQKSVFEKKAGGARNAAIKLGIYKEVCSHMNPDRVKKWTIENIEKEALKYESRFEFQKKADGAYRRARKLGILDKVCSHMKIKGNKMNRMLYSFEFEDKSVYVGLTYDYEKRYRNHLRSSKIIKEKIKNGIKFKFIKFNKLFSIEDVGKEEEKLINEYKSKKWIILNKAKAGALGGGKEKWFKENVQKEALKYKTKSDFLKNSRGAYCAAKRLGIYEKVTKHM